MIGVQKMPVLIIGMKRAGYGTVMAVSTTTPVFGLAIQTLVVTVVAFLAKKLIEHVYSWCRKKIKKR